MIGMGAKVVSSSFTKTLITKNQPLNIAKKIHSTFTRKAYSNDTYVHQAPFEIKSLASISYDTQSTYEKGFNSSSCGLKNLGISKTSYNEILNEIDKVKKLNSMELTSLNRNKINANLVDLQLKIKDFEEDINITITIFPPNLDAVFKGYIDKIEQDGNKWAKNKNLYSDFSMPILEGTFCAGLVLIAYPIVVHSPDIKWKNEMLISSKEGFSYEDHEELDKWLRVLFANDEERDVFSLVEFPEDVKKDNHKIMAQLGHNTSDSETKTTKKISAMKEVFEKFDSHKGQFKKEPFLKTLFGYLESTVLETKNIFLLTWPNPSELETIKVDSSGSKHAIAAGICKKGINLSELRSNLLLEYIEKSSATSVECHNDCLSRIKENKVRLKKLKKILQYIETNYNKMEPYIQKLPETNINLFLEKIENKEHQFFVRFFVKAKEKINRFNLDKESPDKIILNLLDIIPSFNAIDTYVHTGKTLQDSYDIVVKRGNDSVDFLHKSIDNFWEQFKAQSIDIPTSYLENVKKFHRDSSLFIESAKGWASQPIWAISAPRYNINLSKTNERILLSLYQRIKKL